MSKIKALMFGLIAALLMTLAACDTATAPGSDGGPVETEAPDPFWQCPEFLPASVRTPDDEGWGYVTDAQGRPERVHRVLLGRVEPRKDYEWCREKIGNLFGKGTQQERDMYNGGHMIGRQLGGIGKRANIVPQNGNFNKGNWAAMEDQAALCKANDEVSMDVDVIYANNNTIIPKYFTVEFYKLDVGNIEARFENEYEGGADGTQARKELVNWLRDTAGCEG